MKYKLFAVGIIGIALIAFLIYWLPGNNISVEHYDDGVISFDYPDYLNASTEMNANQINYYENIYGYIDEKISYLTRIPNTDYGIAIYIISKDKIIDVPVNETVDNITGIDSEGNYIVVPTNVSSGETKKEKVNALQTMLVNYTATFGEPKKFTKNGYNYYEFEPGKKESYTYYNTIIDKEDYPYLFLIELCIWGNDDSTRKTESYNAYKKITDTFKIG